MTAAAKDLITVARAKQSNRQITDGSYDTALQVWVTAVSDWIEKYCRRDFYSKAYDELYNGNDDGRLILRQYPVQTIAWVRYLSQTVLKVKNTSSANQRATVDVFSTGLTLTHIASGVATVTTSGVTWAACPTLAALATAVTAVGSGWTASAVGSATGNYGLWPSADLYVAPSFGDGTHSMGSLGCKDNWAELRMHTSDLQGYQWDPRGWLLRAIPYTDPDLLDSEALVWPSGINNFRVKYTAGYTTVPEAVQEAAAQWVSTLWSLSNRDPMVMNSVVSSTGYGYSSQEPPPQIKTLLAPYRRYAVGIMQG